MVVYIARKFENSGVGIEDLISIGTIGLIKAVNTFCPTRNIKLATYSSRCIENEILMYLRKNAQPVSYTHLEYPERKSETGIPVLHHIVSSANIAICGPILWDSEADEPAAPPVVHH